LKAAPARSVPVSGKGASERACLAARVAVENKARDVLVLDMRRITPLYDFFVLATGVNHYRIDATRTNSQTVLWGVYR